MGPGVVSPAEKENPTMTKFVRLKPFNPRRGFNLRRYTSLSIGKTFSADRGWYKVDDEVADALAEVSTSGLSLTEAEYQGKDVVCAFDIADSPDHARRIEAQYVAREGRAHKREVGTIDTPILATARGRDGLPSDAKLPVDTNTHGELAGEDVLTRPPSPLANTEEAAAVRKENSVKALKASVGGDEKEMKKELRAMAKERGVELKRGMGVDEIATAIVDADASEDEDDS